MEYILTHQSLSNSARMLGKRLGISQVYYSPIPEIPPTIRWGNSDGKYGNKDTFYNEPMSIYVCQSKLRFSGYCVGAGIPCTELMQGVPDHYPVIVRTTLTGKEGEGIVICKNAEEFAPYSRYYWSYYRRFKYELGVHILDGKVTKVFRKMREEGLEKEKYPIRNTTKGYKFSLRSPEFIAENYPDLQKFVDSLYLVLPINMARLDIGFDRDDNIYRIIEANSAPSLSANKNTFEMYVAYLKEKLGRK